MSDREESVFYAAREKASFAERQVYLRDACGEDQELLNRVEALLAADEDPASFLEDPAIVATFNLPAILEKPGTQIGPYQLREQIGEGGFGLVFVAEQEQPVRRKVALKIIKPGMDTREVIARFEAERQSLALMDHPNIAKVLDAGTTEQGRPYFVMELVKGVLITTFCDERKLSTRERLELFIDVCRAVQHAHQKGIIHRDIKPSNVMVTLHDDKPMVKVIDFGVSKALSVKLTEKTVYTSYGQMIGTPLYMSPEQAQFSGLDIDTRSDVYSLGVLLYELLTGTTPFDKEVLKTAGFDEFRRMIREVDPARPSTRISTLNVELLCTISGSRRIDPRKLSHSLRCELDWIVMRALEKDRNRRYESPMRHGRGHKASPGKRTRRSLPAVDVVSPAETRPAKQDRADDRGSRIGCTGYRHRSGHLAGHPGHAGRNTSDPGTRPCPTGRTPRHRGIEADAIGRTARRRRGGDFPGRERFSERPVGPGQS